MEATAAAELADEHGAWKARYGAQKRLPLATAGETWTANMPEHVVESTDFWIKAPAPADKLIEQQANAEKAAEDSAKPAEPKPVEIPKVPTPAEAEQDQKAAKGEGPPASVVKADEAEKAAAAEAPPAFLQIHHRGDDDGSESSGSDSSSDSDSDSD